jgi:hypothetical protein
MIISLIIFILLTILSFWLNFKQSEELEQLKLRQKNMQIFHNNRKTVITKSFPINPKIQQAYNDYYQV